MEHAKERAMIYTSAGEKTLKIKKDKFISCFKKLPDGGSITGYEIGRASCRERV